MFTKTAPGEISLNEKWCLRRRKCESLKGKDRVILYSRGAMRLLFPKDLILPHCQERKWCSYGSVLVFTGQQSIHLDKKLQDSLNWGVWRAGIW